MYSSNIGPEQLSFAVAVGHLHVQAMPAYDDRQQGPLIGPLLGQLLPLVQIDGNSPTIAVIDGGPVQISTRGRSRPKPTRQV